MVVGGRGRARVRRKHDTQRDAQEYADHSHAGSATELDVGCRQVCWGAAAIIRSAGFATICNRSQIDPPSSASC